MKRLISRFMMSGKTVVNNLIPGILLLPALAMSAFAVTVTVAPQFGPRNFNTQQTGYIRVHAKVLLGGGITVNGKACTVVTTGTCIIKFGAIPLNSFLLRQTQQIIAVFNSTTSDLIGVGTEKATGVNTMAATSVASGNGPISSPAFVAGSSGTLLTTSNAVFGANGGLDLYMSYTWEGASSATTGELIYVLEYAAPNDGDCVPASMGSTPAFC